MDLKEFYAMSTSDLEALLPVWKRQRQEQVQYLDERIALMETLIGLDAS